MWLSPKGLRLEPGRLRALRLHPRLFLSRHPHLHLDLHLDVDLRRHLHLNLHLCLYPYLHLDLSLPSFIFNINTSHGKTAEIQCGCNTTKRASDEPPCGSGPFSPPTLPRPRWRSSAKRAEGCCLTSAPHRFHSSPATVLISERLVRPGECVKLASVAPNAVVRSAIACLPSSRSLWSSVFHRVIPFLFRKARSCCNQALAQRVTCCPPPSPSLSEKVGSTEAKKVYCGATPQILKAVTTVRACEVSKADCGDATSWCAPCLEISTMSVRSEILQSATFCTRRWTTQCATSLAPQTLSDPSLSSSRKTCVRFPPSGGRIDLTDGSAHKPNSTRVLRSTFRAPTKQRLNWKLHP